MVQVRLQQQILVVVAAVLAVLVVDILVRAVVRVDI
jgi:hypothetical protein